MTKKAICQRVAANTKVSAETVATVVQAALDAMTMILAEDGRLELRNFGIFTVEERKARKARNPRTGEAVAVAAKRSVRFKSGKVLKKLTEKKR